MSDKGWYYASGDKRVGPTTKQNIENLIASGEIEAETMVWRDGMDGWQEASNHFNVATPPPLPPSMPKTSTSQSASSASTPSVADPVPPRPNPNSYTTLYEGAPARTMGEAIKECFNNYVGFSGRASRSEYWFFFLFCFLLSLVTSLLDLAIFGPYSQFSPLNSLTSLAVFLPSLAVGFRRLHDIGRSGWWMGGGVLATFVVFFIFGIMIAANPYSEGPFIFLGLFALIGLAYGIVLLIFLCKKGDLEENQYG